MTLDEIRPFGDRILVRPDAKIATSEGGLHIPETVLSDNPNFYTMTGTVVKLGDGIYVDVWECQNQQCRYQSRRTAGEYCPVCKATQKLLEADGERTPFDVQVGDRVLFGRFAGKQIEVDESFGGTRSEGPSFYTTKFLMMREVEILGVVDDDATVLPGYQAAQFNAPSKGLTPSVTTVPR